MRRVVSKAPASEGCGRRESACTGRWGGGRDGRALGRQVEAGVQSSTGRPKPRLFDSYKIRYANLNGGIDECEFSCRGRVKTGWAP